MDVKEVVEDKRYYYAFPMPSVTVDLVIFSIINDKLHLLMIKRKNQPFRGKWALPGGFLEVGRKETLEEAAARELHEETGLRNIFVEQLYTFGDPDRDPRGRTVTVAYYALVPSNLKPKAGDDAKEAAWCEIDDPDGLSHPDMEVAFDHRKIIKMAVERIRGKLAYTNIAYRLLPDRFTIPDLQRVYEIILGEKLDGSNFRRYVKDRGLIVQTNQKEKGRPRKGGRLAKLYKFNEKLASSQLSGMTKE